jgi:hypothetical protein
MLIRDLRMVAWIVVTSFGGVYVGLRKVGVWGKSMGSGRLPILDCAARLLIREDGVEMIGAGKEPTWRTDGESACNCLLGTYTEHKMLVCY